MTDIAKNRDDDVGDGTTSVAILAAEFLKQPKQFVEEGVSPQRIIHAYYKASEKAIKKCHVVVKFLLQYQRLNQKHWENVMNFTKNNLEMNASIILVVVQKLNHAQLFFEVVLNNLLLNQNGFFMMQLWLFVVTKKNDTVVAGGGAIEMELSHREKAKNITTKEQFYWKAYGIALKK